MVKFICNRYPFLRLKIKGRMFEFQNGQLEVSEEDARIVEQHEWVEPYAGAGGLIFRSDPIAATTAIPEVEAPQEVEGDSTEEEEDDDAEEEGEE